MAADSLTSLPLGAGLTDEERVLFDNAAQWFDDHRKEFVTDLIDLVSVPSVSDSTQGTTDAPYGPSVAEVFEVAAGKAKTYGLTPVARGGVALDVRRGEEHSPLRDIAFVSHLDVVPAGLGWDFDPFHPFERDGFVVGRGSSDNKAGALADLYVLRFLNERGIALRHDVKVIYGGAEETSLDDMREYVRRYGAPRQAVISDSPFPANNAQKGHLVLTVQVPAGEVTRSIVGGVAPNAVPGVASAVLPAALHVSAAEVIDALGRSRDPRTPTDWFEAQDSEQGVVLAAHGTSGHAAFPDGTENAIPLLARGLIVVDRELQVLDDADRVLAASLASWFESPYGGGTGIAYADEESGETTQNLGLIGASDVAGSLELTLDIRYAVSQHAQAILDALNHSFGRAGGTILDYEDSEPYYVPADDSRVQTLLGAFNDVLGVQAVPNAMGGGTHARVIPNALNFGPGLGRGIDPKLDAIIESDKPSFIPDGKGGAHGADEWVSIKQTRIAFLIYLIGLLRLDKVLDSEE